MRMLGRSITTPPCGRGSLRSIILALRVINAIDGRPGFVVGRPEYEGCRIKLVPVAVEGSTRYELWPLHRLKVRPLKEQHRALGGTYDPPKGYPLCA